MNAESRFITAIDRFDAANAEDPTLETDGDAQVPAQLLYARRMTARLDAFAPESPEIVRLAARSQHICRWKIPRDSYPDGRDGYRRWRTDLGKFHAGLASGILRDVGYDQDTIDRVASLLQKKRLKADPDCQLLEDVICLVFLEHHLDDFAGQHDEPKLTGILERTWEKMSEAGREAALKLPLSEAGRTLVAKAVGR
jgi:hypothetical protein